MHYKIHLSEMDFFCFGVFLKKQKLRFSVYLFKFAKANQTFLLAIAISFLKEITLNNLKRMPLQSHAKAHLLSYLQQ
jgi:hypothetical protein